MARDRGTYGPLDRDRHLAIGWGTDRIVGYAHDHTIGAALRPILPVIDTASRAQRSARQLWTGTQMMGGRDEAAKSPAVVGQELFHSVADRTHAITTITTGFRALANDLAVWQTANQGLPTASATAQWLAADVTPTLDEWRDFAARESTSWWVRVATNWDTLEEWVNRLRQLRTLARAHGIVLESVDPGDLPKTIWQKGAEGKGSEATAILGILKIGAAAVLTAMGLVGFYSVVQQLRTKHDPRNLALIRETVREELGRKR